MKNDIRKWLFSATLAGTLAAGTGVAFTARAQNAPPEPNAGTKADRQEDRQEIRALRAKIHQERMKLKADERQFGPNSPQVKADEAQLAQDRAALRAMEADRKQDAGIFRSQHPRHRRR